MLGATDKNKYWRKTQKKKKSAKKGKLGKQRWNWNQRIMEKEDESFKFQISNKLSTLNTRLLKL